MRVLTTALLALLFALPSAAGFAQSSQQATRTKTTTGNAPTQSAARIPTLAARTPPVREPSGIVPQTRKRITEFMRPCRRSGVIACRKLTCATL